MRYVAPPEYDDDQSGVIEMVQVEVLMIDLLGGRDSILAQSFLLAYWRTSAVDAITVAAGGVVVAAIVACFRPVPGRCF